MPPVAVAVAPSGGAGRRGLGRWCVLPGGALDGGGRSVVVHRSWILPPLPPLVREIERARVFSPTTADVEGPPGEKSRNGRGYPAVVGLQMRRWITPG